MKSLANKTENKKWQVRELMKLFLCEKPSQGRDIAKVLGAT